MKILIIPGKIFWYGEEKAGGLCTLGCLEEWTPTDRRALLSLMGGLGLVGKGP